MSYFLKTRKKLLTVLLVAVFAVGLGFGLAGEVRGADPVPATQPAYVSALQSFFDFTGGILGNMAASENNNDTRAAIQANINQLTTKRNAYAVNSADWIRYNKLIIYAEQLKTGVVPDSTAAVAAGIKGYTEDETKNINNANTMEAILGSMIAWMLYYIAVGLGWIMMLVVKVMLVIGVFNTFIAQPAVRVGWTITRDVCNNFFIIFMMILAGGVALNLPNYKWRSLLPKILLAAVLINFSLTITGIMIDVSQVLMLTFASPLATVHGNNIILAAFGMPDQMRMQNVVNAWSNNGTANSGITWIDIIAALLFAIIVNIVAIVVIVCIACILVYRIVMLMFLAILSPLPFLARAGSNIKALGSIEGEWMGLMSKMLIVGPAMMFFLYLSFMTMAMVGTSNIKANGTQASVLSDAGVARGLTSAGTDSEGKNDVVTNPVGKGNTSGPSAGDFADLSEMASLTGVFNFMIVVGLLWGSLMMGKKFGDAAGGIAGKGMGMLSSGAKRFSGFNLGKKGLGMAAARGKELIGDKTGYSRIAGATKMYFEEQKKGRAVVRNAGILETANNMSTAIGGFKKKWGDRVSAVGGAVKGQTWDRAFGGRKAKQLEDEAKSDATLLATAEEDAGTKEKAADDAKETLDKLEQERIVLEQIRDNLKDYNTNRAANPDNFKVGDNRYQKNTTSGEYDKIDATTGKVLKSGIKEDDIKEEATGYRDEFEAKQKAAEKAFVAGKTAEAQFDEGGYRYERVAGRWNKVNLKDGKVASFIAAGGNLRKAATGYDKDEDAVGEQIIDKETELMAQRSDSWSKHSDFATAQASVSTQETALDSKKKEAERLKKRQASADKWGKRGLVAAMTVGGAATGGLGYIVPSSIIMGSAGYVAGKGVLGVANGMANAGKGDLGLFKSYNADRINEAAKGISDLDNEDVTAKLEDATLKKFERIAYELEALRRGMVDSAKAKEYKKHIQEETTVGGKEDKKVSTLLNSALAKKYPSQINAYEQYDSADPAEVAKGKRKLEEMIAERRYQLKDLDDTAIEGLMSLYTTTLNDFDAFKRQVVGAEGKEKQIIEALKNTMTSMKSSVAAKEKAGEYLARLTNITEAYGSDTASKDKFTKALSGTEILNIMRDNDEKKGEALAAHINGDMTKLSKRVQDLINTGGSDGKKLKDYLGL